MSTFNMSTFNMNFTEAVLSFNVNEKIIKRPYAKLVRYPCTKNYLIRRSFVEDMT